MTDAQSFAFLRSCGEVMFLYLSVILFMVGQCAWQKGMYDGGHEWGKRGMHGEGGVPGKRCAWQEWHACTLADLGGARPARAPPFAWHPSSLADLGGVHLVCTPPFAWHPSF